MSEPRLTGDPRWDQPCEHWLNGGYCEAMPSRRFIVGRRCVTHTPAALAGQPEPGRTADRGPLWQAIEPPAAPEPKQPPQGDPEDMQPVERSKAGASTRQESKAAVADAKQRARDAARASAGVQ